jgi:signal transduction histidine kinase
VSAPPASKYVNEALALCKARDLDPVGLGKCEATAEASFSGVSKASLEDQRSRTLSRLPDYSLAALVFVSTWLGWIVAGRALRPVHAITAAARRASQENLGERIALAGPDDELKELADTFDAMLGRLDAASAGQRRFVADASHELRTPLTVMRTAIDVTLARPGRTARRGRAGRGRAGRRRPGHPGRSVALAHHGHATARPLPAGGLEVTVSLPAGPAA